MVFFQSSVFTGTSSLQLSVFTVSVWLSVRQAVCTRLEPTRLGSTKHQCLSITSLRCDLHLYLYNPNALDKEMTACDMSRVP